MFHYCHVLLFSPVYNIAHGLGHRYSIDLWIQTYMEAIPLKCGKLAKNIRRYVDFFRVCS